MKIHIVKKGDTLWEISKQYGVDFEEVKQLNSHLSSPDMIMPGMKIKVPSTAKTVKKEMPKEMQKTKAKQPYKDISPKPLPVIKEDDNQPMKDVKPEMPMPQMPLQPMMQMPIMNQEFQQDLTINLPKMPKQPKEEPIKEQLKEQPVQQPVQQPIMQQPIQQPMHYPVQMVPCYPVVHPCWPPVHHSHYNHMHHPGVLGAQFNDVESSPYMEMPMQQMPTGDCGCKGGMTTPMQPGMQPPFGYDQVQMDMGNPAQQVPPLANQPAQYHPQTTDFNQPAQYHSQTTDFNQPTQYPPMTDFNFNQPTQYPPMTDFNFNQPAYPTPPGFQPYRYQEDESSSE